MTLIFLLQLALSEWVWRKQRRLSHKHVGRPIAALFFISFITSHLIYVWADAYFYNPITAQKANFPLSYPMTAKSFMERHGLLDSFLGTGATIAVLRWLKQDLLVGASIAATSCDH